LAEANPRPNPTPTTPAEAQRARARAHGRGGRGPGRATQAEARPKAESGRPLVGRPTGSQRGAEHWSAIVDILDRDFKLTLPEGEACPTDFESSRRAAREVLGSGQLSSGSLVRMSTHAARRRGWPDQRSRRSAPEWRGRPMSRWSAPEWRGRRMVFDLKFGDEMKFDGEVNLRS
jgi:hypothetical protein